ncbi:hypothetical protein V8D89_000368 [Ganoderma adspersum]
MPDGLYSSSPSVHHDTGILNARQASRRSGQLMRTHPTEVRNTARARNLHFKLSTFQTALAVCAIFLAPVVGAEDRLNFTVPSEVTLCRPVNLTWTGGTPPYRLDVELSVDGVPDIPSDQRETGIPNTWYLWTPDFPAGSVLQIAILGSQLVPSASGFATVLSSSDSSCLATSYTAISATSSPSTSPSASSSANGLISPVNQPSATSTPAIFSSSRRGLSKGAIAGIAVAAALIGVGLIALAAWYRLRRRSHEQHSVTEKGDERTIASPTVPYSGPSAPLASGDLSKLTPPTSTVGNSSDSPEDHDPLRPTPYLIARSSTTSLSQALGAGGKKHMRELSNATSIDSTAANTSTGGSEIRAMSVIPDQLGSTDPQDAGDGGGDGDSLRDEDVLRFDVRVEARPLGLGFEDVGSSDVASTSGEMCPPPPYSALRDEGGVRRCGA